MRKFNHDHFSNIEEIKVQFLNERLDKWKNVVFNTIEFSLHVTFNVRTPIIQSFSKSA